MANNKYTVMELEAIKKLCKSVNLIANLPTDLIADTNVATNTTYSSYRIDAEMSALENDIQRYVDTALAGLSRLTKEVIDDKALVVKENVLYLYKDPSDMNNDYMQMMLINGVAVELGSTTCDFSSVYSKDEIDDKFALKIDLDVLTTSFNNFATAIDEKVDKTEMKEITEQDILSKLGLSTNDIETMNKILDDAVVTTTKTFSSSKIYTEIQKCLQDSKDFTLREIANKLGASYKIVTDVVDMTSKDHLYLMNNGGVYDIYIVDDANAPVKIGDTNVDLNGYYSKTEVDNDFLKKADADSKYATITTVDNKIDKDKIVVTLDDTATDEQIPSAKVSYDRIKGLEDKVKDGKFYIRHATLDKLLDCYGLTKKDYTIEELFLALPDDGIRFGLVYNNDTAINKITDLPNGSYFFITIEKALMNYNIVHAYNINNGNYYMWRYHVNSRLARKWEIMNKTSIADVDVTDMILPSNLTYDNYTRICYQIMNGVCYIDIYLRMVKSSTSSTIEILGFPTPKTQVNFSGNGENIGKALMGSIKTDGKMRMYNVPTGATGDNYSISLSYPVAE